MIAFCLGVSEECCNVLFFRRRVFSTVLYLPENCAIVYSDMAYCPLVLNQHPELKICWYAGIMTEKSFKARYKPVTTNKINIVKICEEIEKMCNGEKGGKKFNFYLSSQLMHGVTKLHSYQTQYFEKDVFQTQYKLDSLMLEEINLEDEDARELPDTHPDEFLMEENVHLDKNLLTDYDLEARELQRRVEAMCPNFGALNSLTSEESNLTPRHVEHTISNLERRMEDMTYRQETEDEVYQERRSSQASASVALVDVSKIKDPGTPKRRVPQTRIETPTKRRRLSFPDALAVPLTEEQTAEGTAAPIIQEQVEVQPLDSEPPTIVQSLDLPQTPRSFVTKKPKKTIDKKTIMDKNIIKKWQGNLRFKCRESDLMPIHCLTPVRDLLTQPSYGTRKKWAASLCHLFERHLTGSIRSNVDQYLFPPTEELQTEEVLPAEEAVSRLNLPTEMSALGKDATADSTALGSTMNIPVMDHFTEQHLTAADEPSAMQPELPPPDSSYETVLTPSLTNQDILDKLEVLWREEECVEFAKLLPDPCSRIDITTIFFVLLQLYADAKIVLMQKDCHDILWIRKRFEYD